MDKEPLIFVGALLCITLALGVVIGHTVTYIIEPHVDSIIDVIGDAELEHPLLTVVCSVVLLIMFTVAFVVIRLKGGCG